ncbi:hypothetical protein ABW19_dt0208026 [Dactylella cylindrospora]|nr:hypothetical protein ABW19_dt0208026 [Dactylella cylindrospora]
MQMHTERLESERPHIAELFNQSHLQNPLGSITSSFCNDDVVDILRVDLARITENGVNTFKIESKHHISGTRRCNAFIEQLEDADSFPPSADRLILLLVEDISLAMIEFLCSLSVPSSFLTEYVRGPYGLYPKAYFADTNALYKPGFNTTTDDLILGEVELHLGGTEAKVHNRRNISPDDSSTLHVEWNRVCFTHRDLLSIEAWILRDVPEYQRFSIPEVISPWRYDWCEGAAFARSNRIHRHHYTIAQELSGDSTSAAHEKFSRIIRRFNGHELVIYLFDPPRAFGSRWFTRRRLFPGEAERARPKNNVTDMQRHLLKGSKAPTTRDIFMEYLKHWEKSGKLNRLSVCEAHFIRGLLVESSRVLGVMEETLASIDIDMASLRSLHSKIAFWQTMMPVYRPLLADMTNAAKNIRQMLRLSQHERSGSLANSELDDQITKTESTLKEFLEYVEEISARTEKSFQGLMASMSVIESQQAIDEASSVGKLTELAFFFIPITFAATFYSMQIEALAPTVSEFAILAVSLLAGAYTIRLFIRSRLRQYVVEKLTRPVVRAEHHMSKRDKIPATRFIKFYSFKFFDWCFRIRGLLFLSFIAAGLAMILTLAKTIEFKVTASLLTIATAYLSVHDYQQSKLGYRATTTLIIKTFSFASCYSILGVSMESNFEAAVKVSVSCGFGSVAVILLPEVVFGLDPYSKVGRRIWRRTTFVVPVCIFLATTILFWCPWSHRPVLEAWKKGLITLAVFHLCLFVLTGYQEAEVNLGPLRRPSLRLALLMHLASIVVGIPLVMVWSYGYPNTVSRAVQILVTTASLWSFFGLVYTGVLVWGPRGISVPPERKVKLRQANRIVGALMFGLLLLLLPLLLWFGKIEKLDELATGAKIGITIAWPWGLIAITTFVGEKKGLFARGEPRILV